MPRVANIEFDKSKNKNTTTFDLKTYKEYWYQHLRRTCIKNGLNKPCLNI